MRPDLFNATTPSQITRQVIFERALINGTDEHGDTALHSALRRRASFGVVAELVRLGATVNAMGRLYHTPLLLAIYHPDPRVMEHLVDNGALIDGLDMHLAPLHAAVFNNLFDKVEWLLDRGADPNRIGFRGTTPLFAARTDKMVRRLLLAGADPEHKDQEGHTVIERWREQGTVEALDALQPAKPARPSLKVVGGACE